MTDRITGFSCDKPRNAIARHYCRTMTRHMVSALWLAWLILSASIGQGRTITVAGKDSAAIGAAVADSQAGDTVLLPAGTYSITQAVRPKSQTRLQGDGQQQTVLRFTGDKPSAIVDLAGCQDVEISGLTLDGAGNSNAAQGISAGNACRLRIHHVTIRSLVKSKAFGPHGILFSGSNPSRQGGVTDSEIADCRIENIAIDAEFGGGVRLSWGSSRNRVLRNTICNTGRGGIFADNGSTDLVIQSNSVSGSHGEGLGIEVWGGCDRAMIEDNRIDHWLSFGGCDYGAARRNVVTDPSGEYKFCGIEVIGSCHAITDNVVDGGAKIGLSVSSTLTKKYVFWARNKVRACNQWGAQFQGESSGVACHYLYRCEFAAMPIGHGPVWYPGDEGHGFRMCGNARDMTFEECVFADNGRLGVQLLGAGVDRLSFVRCRIAGNKGAAVAGPQEYSALEWVDCTVESNARNELPPGKAFSHPAPKAAIDAPTNARAGQPIQFKDTSRPATGEIAAVLWDFADGLPSTDRAPTHTYANPGKYRVNLIVWDKTNRAARAEREVDVRP